MEKFEVHILGCGSALPTTRHFATSQVVNIREKLFMIDCGEGAQMQLRKSKLKFTRLNHIFISHLHGDHCFGLMGYKVVFQTFDPGKAEIIYDDRSLTIETIPLRHRIPTCGFLFSEK